MNASLRTTRTPRPDRVHRQALQLLATTACSWNLAGHGARAPAAPAGAGPEPLRRAAASHPSTAL